MSKNGISALLFVEFFDGIHTCAHVGKHGIYNGNGSHGFDDHNGTWYDDWIMASADVDINLFPDPVYCLLSRGNRGSWLDGGAQDNV